MIELLTIGLFILLTKLVWIIPLILAFVFIYRLRRDVADLRDRLARLETRA